MPDALVNIMKAISMEPSEPRYFAEAHLYMSYASLTPKQLTEFLGVDHLAPDLQTVINSAPGGDIGEDNRMLAVRKFGHVYHFIHDFFSGQIPDSWVEDLDRVQCHG